VTQPASRRSKVRVEIELEAWRLVAIGHCAVHWRSRCAAHLVVQLEETHQRDEEGEAAGEQAHSSGLVCTVTRDNAVGPCQ
jgi:hypothetical protein